MSSNNDKNKNIKDCKHAVLSETDLSCIVCGMSRYNQLQNKKRLTKKEEKEWEDFIVFMVVVFKYTGIIQ
jgi:hypothetical protein